MRVIVATLAVSLLRVAAADTPPEASFSDIAATLAEPAVIRGRFEQTRILRFGEFTSSGRFVLSDAGLLWIQEYPVDAILVADSDGVAQRVGDTPWQSLDAQQYPMVLSFSRSFLGIFRGDESRLRSNFDVAFEIDGDDWRATLVPTDELMDAAIREIRLAGRDYIHELTVETQADDRMVIRFLDVEPGSGQLSDDEIEFYAR